MASKLWTVCIFILVVEMMERLTYYTFQGSQRNFLSQWFDSAQSISISSAFGVLCYTAAILGGWLADAKAGRYMTLLIFAVVYCVGVAMAAISAWPTINNEVLYLIAMFLFVAFGTGGIKPNVANFGADQYDTTIEKEAKQQQQFFSYFYMMINVGAAVAYGYLVTLATNGQPPGIPQQYGYFSAYMIAAGCMFIAFFIFLVGTPRYVRKPPSGDSLAGGTFYIIEAAKRNTRGKIALVGWCTVILFILFAFASAFVPRDMASIFAYVSLALAFICTIALTYAHLNHDFMAELPEQPSQQLSLQDAKDFFSIVPTILVTNICFMIVYNMMSGPMAVQACQMNLQTGDHQINGAFLNIGDCFAIVFFTPIFEGLLFPLIAKLKGSPVSRNQQLVAGFVTAALAMVSCIILEYVRQASPVMDPSQPNTISNCAGNPETNPVPMSELSVFWMFIPFALIGIAEILINPLMYYFSYDQVPFPARSLAQAFNLLAQGALSQGYTTVITQIFAPFLGANDNLNNGGAVQNFYYLGLAFAIVGIPLVLFVSSFYKDKDFKNAVEDDGKPPAIEEGKLSGLAETELAKGGSFEKPTPEEPSADQGLISKPE